MEYSTTRFRFREHIRQDDADSETSSGISSVYSELDSETELESMTGKGIKYLCSELLELKIESDEDFRGNIFSNHASFVRILDEVKKMENEMMQLESQVLTQKRLVKDLIDGINVLCEETLDSIVQDSEIAEPTGSSDLEVHTHNISETLDVLVLENRVDEAIDILTVEEENLHRIQFEDNSGHKDLLFAYDSVISEKKAMITLQLTLLAENSRISAAELQKVLVGICKLGDSHLATQLLLKYYHSRVATGIHNLQKSQSFLDVLYVKELAKFVFSMISQAARSFMMLYGQTSPYASELIQWAREETKLFVSSFHKYIKSNSDVSGGLSTAIQAMEFAISYCSLLKSQRLFLRPYLIKHIRPSMEEVLHVHIHHFKKVVNMFTVTDDWVLGRYLVSEILCEGNYKIFEQQSEYCILSNSGRKFLTLLQMEGSILEGLANIFSDYIAILEKAITFEAHVSQKGLRRTSAESLSEQISVLANLSTVQNFFFQIIRNFFRGTGQMISELRKKKSIDFQQKELDGCAMFIQEVASQLRDHFYQKFINRMMSLETGYKLIGETSNDKEDENSLFHDAIPSVAFQVLFLELRKADKLAENVLEEDWLMELLRELLEAILTWIVNDKRIWESTKENSTIQLSDIINQFVLDMHFLVEIINYGGYFSAKPSVFLDLVDLAFTSAGLDPRRDVEDDIWAKNAAVEAIQKLLEVEKMQLVCKDNSVNTFSEEPHENDIVHDESIFSMKDSLELDEDPQTVNAVEVAIMEAAGSAPDESLSHSDVEFSSDKSCAVLADNSGKIEDVESENCISYVCDDQCLQKRTNSTASSSFEAAGEASDINVRSEVDAGSGTDASASVINGVEGDGMKDVAMTGNKCDSAIV